MANKNQKGKMISSEILAFCLRLLTFLRIYYCYFTKNLGSMSCWSIAVFFNQWVSEELLTRVRINIAKEAKDTEPEGTIHACFQFRFPIQLKCSLIRMEKGYGKFGKLSNINCQNIAGHEFGRYFNDVWVSTVSLQLKVKDSQEKFNDRLKSHSNMNK